MAKITLNKSAPVEADTPSAQLVRASAAEAKVTDARGRIITLRKPPVLAQLRFIECLGESSTNQGYLAMTLPMLYVAAIDGKTEPALVKKSMVEALCQRLDEDGLMAIRKGVLEHFGETLDTEEAKKK